MIPNTGPNVSSDMTFMSWVTSTSTCGATYVVPSLAAGNSDSGINARAPCDTVRWRAHTTQSRVNVKGMWNSLAEGAHHRTGFGNVLTDRSGRPQADDRTEGRVLLPRVSELVALSGEVKMGRSTHGGGGG